MRECLKCRAPIPWRIWKDGRIVSLTKRKFCLACSPLFGRNTKNLNADKSVARKCPRCIRIKPVSEFYKRRDGRASVYCIPCSAADSLERQIAFKNRAMLYKGGKCIRCGFTGPAVCFDFHHRDRSGKEACLNIIGKRKWDRAVKELDKCDLVCSNCHRIIEHALRAAARANA